MALAKRQRLKMVEHTYLDAGADCSIQDGGQMSRSVEGCRVQGQEITRLSTKRRGRQQTLWNKLRLDMLFVFIV